MGKRLVKMNEGFDYLDIAEKIAKLWEVGAAFLGSLGAFVLVQWRLHNQRVTRNIALEAQQKTILEKLSSMEETLSGLENADANKNVKIGQINTNVESLGTAIAEQKLNLNGLSMQISAMNSDNAAKFALKNDIDRAEGRLSKQIDDLGDKVFDLARGHGNTNR